MGVETLHEVELYFSRCPQDTPIYKKKNFEETWNITARPGGEKCVSSFSDELESPESHSIIISGVPGVGKTTLVKDLVNRWHSSEFLHSFERILIFSICESDQIDRKDQRESIPQHELNSSGKSWLFIFHQCGTDFIDKLPPGSLVKGILAGQVMHKATLLFICMPSEVEELESLVKIGFDCCYSLHGFTSTGLERYLKSNTTYSSEILSYLQCNQLTNLCSNPLVCTKIVQIFQGRRFEEPKTLTGFLCKPISALVFHHLDPEEKASIGSSSQLALESLPESVGAAFDGACLLAYEHMLFYGHIICADGDTSQHFLSTLSLKLPGISLNDIGRFGLVNASAHSGCVYEFLDPIIIQFLTAFYLHKQSPLNQVTLFYHKTSYFFSTNCKLWLQIFFGLVGGDYSKHTSLFNPTKLMLNTVIDVLVHSLELNYEAEYRYTLIKCIFENQEKSLMRKLASKHPAVLSFSVSMNELNKSIKPVSTLINKSGCSEWTVSTCSANRWVVDKIKESTISSVTIAMNLDHGSSEVVYFSPKRSSSAVQKMYRDGDSSHQTISKEEKLEKLNQFCCRAVREILQRVLTLYSPVKIKGDASNVSYVSFLTCACFKDSFLAHVKVFPLQPVHFLPGPKRDLAKLPKESLTPTDRHNLEQHNGESMEVVIMLRPIIQKLEGVVPVTNQRFSLLFSHGPLDFSPESSSSSDESKLVSMERCIDRYQINGPLTEQILPPLPVVQKTIYGRSQTAYPKPLLPPVQVPRAEPKAIMPTIGKEEKKDLEIGSRGNSNSTTLNPIVMTQLQVPAARRIRLSQALSIVATSVQPSQVQNFAEQAVGNAQVHQDATLRKQTAPRPGTVLFTSMPEKIPSDRIQPLPLQHSLIRKGGNGSIFSENLAGTALAVKKTSYRSKEYAILTKIHHKNIIPLLAYVWGEEHAESRRRYYVYHYLPKLSGDLARLVTDKEELSLYEFHKEHQYTDLKAMGAALGNIKYILSQVLQKVTIFLK